MPACTAHRDEAQRLEMQYRVSVKGALCPFVLIDWAMAVPKFTLKQKEGGQPRHGTSKKNLWETHGESVKQGP